MLGKYHVFLVPFVFVLACGSGSKQAVDQDAAASAGAAKDGEDAVNADEDGTRASDESSDKRSDERSDKIKRWSLTYSGALSGEIGGDFIVVTRAGPNAVIKARGDDVRMSVTLSKQPGTEPPVYGVLPMSADLADGTKCTMSNMPAVNVKADEKDALEIELSGALECGEDKKKISYTASVEKRG